MIARDKVIEARKALLNGSGKLTYFEGREIDRETVSSAWIGYEADRGAFTYPCIARGGGLLGIHCKTEDRDAKGKRKQWWEGFADELPAKGHGKNPQDPAKIIPFGLELLQGLQAGSLVVLCCGEEDALSLRQAGYAALSQPGAGLLEPAYAREFAGFEVVIFYDAGEEPEARKDALTLEDAGGSVVRVVQWPPDALHGSDVNGRLVEDPDNFASWAAKVIEGAQPLSASGVEGTEREGVPDAYVAAAPEAPWPTLAEEALHGLPGEIVRTIEPHTEADPVAVLVNLLVACGNAIGRGAYYRVGADRHHLNLNAALVGETSKGRKGSSWGFVRELMHAAEPTWTEQRVLNGLSSGEGLIYEVRDSVVNGDEDGDPIVVDEGAPDKRLLVVEGELAGPLKAMTREGNTLSTTVRQAWDGAKLAVLTKNSPLKATDAHVSIIGHVTKAELLRRLSRTDTEGGFTNRFLWLMVRRSKVLPFGGEWQSVDAAPLVRRLRKAVEFGRNAGEVAWGESAREPWAEVYGPLSEGKPGMLGAATGRAEAQVARLAALYAVLDHSRAIKRGHLMAALALWDYADESARYIFGDATGDPVADRIAEALAEAGGDGMSRTRIRDLFKRHESAEKIGQALTLLVGAGRVRCERKDTGGRPVEMWFSK